MQKRHASRNLSYIHICTHLCCICLYVYMYDIVSYSIFYFCFVFFVFFCIYCFHIPKIQTTPSITHQSQYPIPFQLQVSSHQTYYHFYCHFQFHLRLNAYHTQVFEYQFVVFVLSNYDL